MGDHEGFVAFLASAGADRVHHHGGTLLDHLVATHRLLVEWGCPPHVCSAGLFHSFYSWLAEPTAKSRVALAEAIGQDAEALVHLFTTTSPEDVLDARKAGAPDHLLLRNGSEDVPVQFDVYCNLLRLDLANTQDLLDRVPLTVHQRQRLQSRRAALQSLLAPVAVGSRSCP